MSNLPKGWSLEIFENISTLQRGTSFTKANLIEGIIPVIAGGKEPAYYHNDYNREGETITISGSGANAGFVNYFDTKIFVSDGFTVKGINDISLTKYLFYFLKWKQDYIYFLQSGGAQPHVYLKDIAPLNISFPPLQEQKKIADILSTVDKKIAFVEENIKATEELKKGLMQKLLTEGIGHSEFKDSELGTIPESWEIKSIEDIAEVKGGKRLPKGSSLSEEKTPYPYIRVTNMFMGGIDLSEIQYVPVDIQPQIKNYTISKNDLFISVAGTLGIVGEVPKELDNANLTENADKLTNIKIDRKYLLYIFMSNLIQNEISKHTTSNAQPKLALTKIKTFKIPVAPLEEQKQIVEILSTVDNKLENLKYKKQSFEELKKGLMQKLLTVEVRV